MQSRAERLTARWHILRVEASAFYDAFFWRPLSWPGLSLAWLPAAWPRPPSLLAEEAAAGGEPALPGLHTQYLVLGTQTSGQDQNRVLLARVAWPPPLPAGTDPAAQPLALQAAEIQPVRAIQLGRADANRLALMPADPSMLAVCSDDPSVLLFDLAAVAEAQQALLDDSTSEDEADGRQPDEPGSAQSSRRSSASGSPDAPPSQPLATLGGRDSGGFALAWRPQHPGCLLGADLAGGVQLWDVAAGSGASSSSSSSQQRRWRSGQVAPLLAAPAFVPCAVNDASWHAEGRTYALATDEGQVWLQDARLPLSGAPVAAVTVGGSASAAVASAATAAAAAAAAGAGAGTGSESDAAAALGQGRSRACQAHVARARDNAPPRSQPARDCLTVAFDPLTPHRLASGGADGRVCILDMRRLQHPLEELAMHAGSVLQVAWSSTQPGLLASTGEDGHVLLWDAAKMRHALPGKQQQQQQLQQAGEPGGGRRKQAAPQRRAAPAPAAAGADGLQLPAPTQTRTLCEVQQLALPGLLWAHVGLGSDCAAVAFNPDVPWTLASLHAGVFAADARGEEVPVAPPLLAVWRVNTAHGLLC